MPIQGQDRQLQIEAALDQAKAGDEAAEEVAKGLIDEEKRDKAWIVDEEMMKVFVNSEKWTLGESLISNIRSLLTRVQIQESLKTPFCDSSCSSLRPLIDLFTYQQHHPHLRHSYSLNLAPW